MTRGRGGSNGLGMAFRAVAWVLVAAAGDAVGAEGGAGGAMAGGKPAAPADKAGTAICTHPYQQLDPRAAWNPLHQCYLVAWEDGAADWVNTDIGGRYVGRDGQPLGDPFLLAWEMTGACKAPAVACAPQTGNFLVTWRNMAGWNDIVWARVVFSDWSLGPAQAINSAPSDLNAPVASWSPHSLAHLVVWQSSALADPPWSVLGRLLGPAGEVIGGTNFILASTASQSALALAADTADGGWLVASEFVDPASGHTDIHVVRVTASGAPAGAPVVICSDAMSQISPRLVFDPTRDGFLATWVDLAVSPARLRGRRLAQDGTPLARPFTVCEGLDLVGQCDLAWSDAARGFLAPFTHYYGPGDDDVHAVLIPASGPVGEPAVVVSNLYSMELAPSLAYADGLDFLAVWQDGRNTATTGWDVYGTPLRLGCFAGNAWSGIWPERDTPLAGVPVSLHACASPWTPGALLASGETDGQGRFALPFLAPQSAYILSTLGLPYFTLRTTASLWGAVVGTGWIGFTGPRAYEVWDQNEFWFQQGTGVDDTPGAPVPLAVSPNPFNPRATVRFALARAGRAEVAVHDQRGRRVRLLADAAFDAGSHALAWDGRDDRGHDAPSGVYVVRVVTAEGTASRKATLAR